MTTVIFTTGGRDYKDADRVFAALSATKAKYGASMLIQGGAKGADTLAKNWALSTGILGHTVEADWDRLGNWAGQERNQRMGALALAMKKAGMSVHLVAFPGGKGTAGMIKIWEKNELGDVLRIKPST